MTDHLPECRYVVFQQQGQIPEAVIPMGCICPALRACEQRVLESAEQYIKAHMEGKRVGFSLGVQAARDAVVSVKHDNRLCPDSCCQQLRYALAAIDGLKEKNNE